VRGEHVVVGRDDRNVDDRRVQLEHFLIGTRGRDDVRDVRARELRAAGTAGSRVDPLAIRPAPIVAAVSDPLRACGVPVVHLRHAHWGAWCK
jgi:hypothetical protein